VKFCGELWGTEYSCRGYSNGQDRKKDGDMSWNKERNRILRILWKLTARILGSLNRSKESSRGIKDYPTLLILNFIAKSSVNYTHKPLDHSLFIHNSFLCEEYF
jgi:hypothetical protein